MPKNFLTRGHSLSLTRNRKIAIAGVGTLGAAALAFTVVPGGGQTATTEAAAPAKVAYSTEQIQGVKADVTDRGAAASEKVASIEAKQKATTETAAKKKAATQAAVKKAAQERQVKEAVSRSAQRAPVKQVSAKTYPNNLDGWIRESLAIMKKHGIPGTYSGIHRNVMRESSGNPMAINNWDINAINGIPSKGLLQVIPPTFKSYHVPGTSWNIYDPVANITAACNYAADRYGSMDNVNSAY